jgi:hypothetical protein
MGQDTGSREDSSKECDSSVPQAATDLVFHPKKGLRVSKQCARCRRIKLNKEFFKAVGYYFQFCNGCRKEISQLTVEEEKHVKYLSQGDRWEWEELEDEEPKELSEEDEYRMKAIYDVLSELDG